LPSPSFPSGLGTPKAKAYRKNADAIDWWRTGAEKGFALSQYILGFTYEYGKGVLQNYSDALIWYRRAADQGHPQAQSNLGQMYELGRGVGQDFAKAAKWYSRAADQGWAQAQSNLGLMYEKGRGVPQDYVQAHKWMTLVLSGIPASESDQPNQAAASLDRVAAAMTPEQIAEAKRLASEWKLKKN
jgi:TPR repeat protein